MIKIKPEELTLLAQYIHNISGIFYDQKKAYLFESRLGPLVEELCLSNYTELYHKAKSDSARRIEKKIVDAISTNETLFFRDTGPFDLLKQKIMPDLIDARSTKIAARQIPLSTDTTEDLELRLLNRPGSLQHCNSFKRAAF